MIDRLVDAGIPADRCCRVLGVARQNYYKQKRTPPTNTQLRRQRPTPTPTTVSTPTPTTTPTTVPTSSPPLSTAAAPSKMRAPKVVTRGRKVIVKWAAATTNGSPITRYLVDISKGKDTTTGASARKVLFKRLRPGRYRIRIAARNAIGMSPYSGWVKFRVR